ncbi:MAG: prepilin-type N-terminal cleavage/methylation domain-containing protein [Phycisphaerae bacterium]|nr:prepilin-type N-terminal cleavage/methylation domain-containing protein [Phycisphaerae bacterium]
MTPKTICPAHRLAGPNALGTPMRRNAFTLIEILITLAIIAIALGIALPTIGSLSTTRLREAASLLAADLEFARVDTIAHSDEPRMIVFDPATATYHIALASDPVTPITNPVDGQPYLVKFGLRRAGQLDGVAISSVTVDGGDNQLGFGMYGQLDQAAAAVITLEAEGTKIDITLHPTTGEGTVGAFY